MKKNTLILFVFVLGFQLSFSQERTLYFTSLEWPPFVGENLLSKGLSTYIIQKAFETEGYKVEVSFYSWARTVEIANSKDSIIGYFPEYYSKEIEKEFYFSESIGESNLGFVENINNIIKWNTLDDLKKHKIGTVIGYVNTEEFDMLSAFKKIQIEEVSNDLLNIKKVGANRIPLAVIDRYVLEYYLKYDKTLIYIKDKIQFNQKNLEIKKLYVCFKKTDEGRRYMEIFNRGLKKINIKELEKKYMEMREK